jgi:hypothetical protein
MVHTSLCVHVQLHGWGVVSKLAGMVVRGGDEALKVEGVSGAAAWSLCILGILFSSPPSGAADVTCISCSVV